MSAILLRFGLLPFVVAVQDKNDYFRALMAVSFDSISMSTLIGIYVQPTGRCRWIQPYTSR